MKKVAIIIPVYNTSEYLTRCLNSVFNQIQCPDWVICINDGSDDGSGEILNNFLAAHGDVMRLINQPNGGLSSARNAGLDYVFRELSCDYVCFLDSDDYLKPNFLQTMKEHIGEADLLVCGFDIIDSLGRCSNHDYAFPSGSYDALNFWDYVSSVRFGAGVVAWNKLYKINLFDSIRFKPGVYHEDQFIIHHIVEQCTSIVAIDEKLYCYVKNLTSITARNTSRKQADSVRAFVERCRYFIEMKNDAQYIITMNRCLQEFICLSKIGDKDAIRESRIAIRQVFAHGGYGQKWRRAARWKMELFFPWLFH